MRRQVSLLLDHGHHQARHYPIGMAWEEAQIVVERVNQQHATEATLMHAAAAAVMGGKKGQAGFRKLIKELSDG